MSIELFRKKSECAACGACLNICPHRAITMQEDNDGFLYPQIDKNLCTECGSCLSVCNFKTTSQLSAPKNCYAAINRDEEVLLKSASGGVFSAFAKEIIENGGIAFGCKLDKNFHPRHAFAKNEEELELLRGTKYVQSDIKNTFHQAKLLLENGKQVLFSGTPCQIDGLYGFLGKDYENLLTVDLICHGVSNEKFFNAYIGFLQKQVGGEIKHIFIRDKKRGWGMSIRLQYEKDGKVLEKIIPSKNSSYLQGFLRGDIYRENCYLCKYASAYRVGDFTIGDYWGATQEHPELFENGGHDSKKGVSVVLVNSEKAKSFLDNCKYLDIYPTDLKKIARHNTNLVKPTFRDDRQRTKTLSDFAKNGYEPYDKRFMKQLGFKKYINAAANICPRWLRKMLGK